MNHEEAGRYWEANADAWTALARQGYDVYRDRLNTPAFFASLPDIQGQAGLDIGCGEGSNTRLLADRGARVTAIDISERFIGHARQAEAEDPRGIDYHVASAVALPFPDAAFDFATAFMCLMDVPEADQALAEAYRVLKPGGFFQFSITHPCFDTPQRRNLRGPDGKTRAIEVGRYFDGDHGAIEEWIFSSAPAELREAFPRFRVPRFHRTLSGWIQLLIDRDFLLEYVGEPRPSEETVLACPALQDSQVVAYFLHVRVRKPGE